jgi:hypothetical protein
MPMTDIADLIRDLEQASPELEALVREHLTQYDELLAHVLFGDVTRWLVSRGPVPNVLDLLEHHCRAGNEAVQDVLGASFLETLEPNNPEYTAIREALGPCLAEWLRASEARTRDDAVWRPDAT